MSQRLRDNNTEAKSHLAALQCCVCIANICIQQNDAKSSNLYKENTEGEHTPCRLYLY